MIEPTGLAVFLTAFIGPMAVVSSSIDWRDLYRVIDGKTHWPDGGVPAGVTLFVMGVLAPALGTLAMGQVAAVVA